MTTGYWFCAGKGGTCSPQTSVERLQQEVCPVWPTADHIWKSYRTFLYQNINELSFFYPYREKERRHSHNSEFLSLLSPLSTPLAC